jgi:hypothetical protein
VVVLLGTSIGDALRRGGEAEDTEDEWSAGAGNTRRLTLGLTVGVSAATDADAEMPPRHASCRGHLRMTSDLIEKGRAEPWSL